MGKTLVKLANEDLLKLVKSYLKNNGDAVLEIPEKDIKIVKGITKYLSDNLPPEYKETHAVGCREHDGGFLIEVGLKNGVYKNG